MFKKSSSYPTINKTIQEYVEKLSKTALLSVPAGISYDKYHKIQFDALCFQDLGLNFRISNNGHFLFDNGLQYWSTEKFYDSNTGDKGDGLLNFITHVNNKYNKLISATGLFTF